ncbi:hypothetical protein [Clostridium neonatale]|uniref:hypothetical protein n=1 Tax=Clostridium neonatale TaxID=137838 RepID=UPI00291C15A5|nr:hypothetical protein [Clostridium neonatale]CAI3578702.1 conserved hypothetical protein [Clostridium neonatale]CAI3659955.1 conserved hypothetical protein [Clostridium neonatale]CAI3718428.1 conserved hypothetical protein [Clostridium neonatale]CAI3724312.1 conserved hypothetical protein [Clostridium neonatale]CAI3733680.1 conserved hypothetical protein [Clostridium neonatale]
MENMRFQLSDYTRQKIINFISKFLNWFNDFIEKISNYFRNIYSSIDWNKYKRYLKYQKRVKNRAVLFVKRKSKYGR